LPVPANRDAQREGPAITPDDRALLAGRKPAPIEPISQFATHLVHATGPYKRVSSASGNFITQLRFVIHNSHSRVSGARVTKRAKRLRTLVNTCEHPNGTGVGAVDHA
jgi:hypothetical protein